MSNLFPLITRVMENVDSNVIPDSLDMCDNDNQADQNAEECDDERALLANLIENLKLDTDEDKKIHEQLKKKIHHSLMNYKSASLHLKSANLVLRTLIELKTRFKSSTEDKNIAISELKKLIEKCKGKSVETKIDKPSAVRQPNAFKIPKPSVLGKPTIFSDSLERKNFSKTKLVTDTNVSEGLSKPVTTHILPQTASQVVRNTNAKASPTQAWLWHRRLSHLNFDTINLLYKKDIVNGLPKLKYAKDQLCLSCELIKAKRSTFKTKTVPSLKGRLNFLIWTYVVQCGLKASMERNTFWDSCILVGYSTPSKGYEVYNKRTRLVVGSIHINFNEIKELSKASDYDNSSLTTQRQNLSSEQTDMTFKNNSSSLSIQDHNNEPSSSMLVPNVSPLADTNASSLQELEFLFSPLFEEYFTAGNQSVSKSSSLSDNSTNQNTQPTTNIQPTTEPITPTINVNAEEKTMIKQQMHKLMKTNFTTSSIHRYMKKHSHLLAMLIIQTCIHSTNVINLNTDGPKITH
uniref:Gag-Pol polyprotein n=1 Tax=Tanacetum cinerariifolium TaxID=118510 RepID=A0A699HEY0_TANCI|nr:Gag-Pol polyprotein [Tanacetum cinerariifolium]